ARHLSGASIYQKERLEELGRWASRRSPTESPKWSSSATWNRSWSPCSTGTPTGIVPGKSAHDALAVARRRCWRHDWVLDLDIKSFFDEIDWGLLMQAVRRHTDCQWVLLYLQRWLEAPMSMPDGTLVERTRGTPQGAVVSPALANLFLHYVFDLWMRREHPDIPFERYADDAICHCRSEAQALELRQALEKRFADCKLQLHPQKTKVVYCKDANRPGQYPERSFDFLGYTFRPRLASNHHGERFVAFIPAVSKKAGK